MITLFRALNRKEVFLIGFVILSQLILSILEPILLIMVLDFISSLSNESIAVRLNLFVIDLEFTRKQFYSLITAVALVKVVFSLFIYYLQNYLSFYLSKKFSLKILEIYHGMSIDYLLKISRTEKIRFILIEMETLAKAGFQNVFLLVTELFLIISILGYIIISNNLFTFKLFFIFPFILLIYIYSRIVKLKSRQLGNKRSLNDNSKMSIVSGLFQDVVLFKLIDLSHIKIKLNNFFNEGIRISASQTTIEGSFKVLLESLIYISILIVPFVVDDSFSFDKLTVTLLLIMRLIPSLSRVLSIVSGLSYIKFIVIKLEQVLGSV